MSYVAFFNSPGLKLNIRLKAGRPVDIRCDVFQVLWFEIKWMSKGWPFGRRQFGPFSLSKIRCTRMSFKQCIINLANIATASIIDSRARMSFSCLRPCARNGP